MGEEQSFEIRLRRKIVDPEKPPEVVHHVVWTRVDREVVLEVGFVDLTSVALAKAGVERDDVDLTFYVTHRLSFGPEAQKRLVKTMERLGAALQIEAGDQPQTSEEEERDASS